MTDLCTELSFTILSHLSPDSRQVACSWKPRQKLVALPHNLKLFWDWEKRSGINGYLCQETVWIEGQVDMPFQIRGIYGWEWNQGVCVSHGQTSILEIGAGVGRYW